MRHFHSVVLRTGTVFRILAVAIALIVGEGPGTANAVEIGLSAEEQAWIKANPRIRVHNEMDWPPFNFAVDGKPQGYSIDYMNLLAARAGLTVEYATGPTWNEFLGMMKAGTLDVMLNIVKTPDRQKYLLYTPPYADNPNTILSRKEDGYESLQQLFGKTVSVPKGFFYEEVLKREFPRIKLHLVKDTLETMKAVSFGKADAAVGELAVFNHLVARHLMTGLVVSGEVKMGDPELSLLNIATRKDLPVLASILRKGVAAITPEERKAIENKWVSAQHGLGVDTMLVARVGAVGAAIILIIFIWNRQLRHQVKSREVTQRELTKKEAHLRLSLDQMSDGLFQLDKDLRFTLFNDRYIQLVDVPEDLVQIGRHIKDELRFLAQRGDYGRGDPEAHVADRLAALGGGERRRIELATPNRVLELRQTPTQNGGVVAVVSDVTETKLAQKAMQESEALLKSLLNHANAIIVMKDRDLRYVMVNKEFADHCGMTVDDMIGRTAADIHSAERATSSEKSERLVIETRMPKITESSLANADGEYSDYQLIKYPVFDDQEEVILVGTIATNITEHKKAEEALRKAKEEAERVAEAKSEFIAVVSHEVRTPMNGVLGMARLMLEEPLLAEQRGQVQTIVDSGEALLGILNDLLDVSKLEAGKLELESIPFAPQSLIAETANVMASRAKEKGLYLVREIAPNVPDALMGDANRLRQVLLNFLSNAIKFTDRGTVTVRLGGARSMDGRFQLILAVADTGIGILPEEIEKLFSPYVQVTVDIARRRGGTGLGLSICRQLAELMGGEITLESAEGKGSVFTLTAPFEITDAAPRRFGQSNGASALSANGPRLRLLLVEDNVINRKVADGMLVRLGHTVVTAENGVEALERVDNDDPFDIILMDRHMPVMDGIEATKRIRAMDWPVRDIPIIALTAAATSHEIETCLECGMNDVVTKPIDPFQLKTVLLRVAAADGEIFDVPSLKAGDTTELVPEVAPILDSNVLGKLRGEFGEEAADEFIADFNDIGSSVVEAFRQAAEAGDLAQMSHHSHNLKSSAAIIGLMRFSELCRQIELACIADDMDRAVRLGSDIQSVLDDSLAALIN